MSMSPTRRGLSILVLGLAVIAQSSCGGGGGPGRVDIQYPVDLAQPEDVPAMDQETATRDQGTDRPFIGRRYEIVLLHDTTMAEVVKVGGTLPVRAKVIDYQGNGPADGVYLQYDITAIRDVMGNSADDGDASFESQGASTDQNGMAFVLFRAGLIPDRLYTVTISMPDGDAEPKSLDLMVAGAPVGCLDIKMAYDGALPASALVDLDIYVLPSVYDCDVLSPERGAPEDSAVIADRTLANLYGTARIEGLPAETRYTVFALGHRKGSPCVVAYSCIEGVYVAPQTASTCDNLKLEMYLAVLSPTGRYDCVDHFDFTNLVKQCAGGDTTIIQCTTTVGDLGKTVCCVLAEMIKFFQTPGMTIIETIQELAKQWLGSLIVDKFFNLFKDAVARIVTDWLLNNSPPFIQDFFRIGGDMMGAITNLEMMSDLRVSKLGNDYTTQGDQYWHGLALYWKFGCDPRSPDYATCGRIALDLEALNDPLFPTDLLGGKFTAVVADFDKWIVNQHAIKLNYGKLVLYVLNEVIIKSITGGRAHNLKEVARLWLDCNGIGGGIFGDIMEWFGGTRQQVVDLCNTAVDFLFGFVDVFLNNLSMDTELSVSGTARLVDLPNENQICDLKADRITDGKYLGYVQGGATQASVTGQFECERQ